MKNKTIHSALFGVAIGDALGVPVEFRSREYLKAIPVTDMLAFGTHNQPIGTWSGDSSLTFCLAEMLTENYDLKNLANRFINWYEYGYWTASGEVFDIGIATSKAIYNLEQDINPIIAGGADESDNGNGSLMRILPLLFYIKDMPIEDRFKYVSEVSSLTHRHIRSIIGCFIYIEFARQLLRSSDKFEAYIHTKDIVNKFLKNNPICSENEINNYHHILSYPTDNFEPLPLYKYSIDKIASSGYVVHSLEAALWCIFKEDNFEDTILRTVNLANDTDTIAAIAGGLAGLLYGFEAIPTKWINRLVRKDDIYDLCNRLEKKLKQ